MKGNIRMVTGVIIILIIVTVAIAGGVIYWATRPGETPGTDNYVEGVTATKMPELESLFVIKNLGLERMGLTR